MRRGPSGRRRLPVLDQPSGGSLDKAAGNRPAGGEERGAGALGRAVAAGGGAAADPGAHVAVLADQDLGGLFFHPGPGARVAG